MVTAGGDAAGPGDTDGACVGAIPAIPAQGEIDAVEFSPETEAETAVPPAPPPPAIDWAAIPEECWPEVRTGLSTTTPTESE